MAGLVPERRTRDQIQQANQKLVKEHRALLEAWVAEKRGLVDRSDEDAGGVPTLTGSKKRKIER